MLGYNDRVAPSRSTGLVSGSKGRRPLAGLRAAPWPCLTRPADPTDRRAGEGVYGVDDGDAGGGPAWRARGISVQPSTTAAAPRAARLFTTSANGA